MGCGASTKPKNQTADGMAADQTATEDGVEQSFDDLSKNPDCVCRICFDWAPCEFDIALPAFPDDTPVSEEIWYEFINLINFEILAPFAEKWKDQSLGASVGQAACKSVMKEAAKDAVSLVAPAPATMAMNMAFKVADKVEAAAKAKMRRKEWEKTAMPALTEYLKECSEKAASNKVPVKILVGDAKLTPGECAELKARRTKFKTSLYFLYTQATLDEDANAGDKKAAKLREILNSFHQKAESAESNLKAGAENAKEKVEGKLDEAGSAGEKLDGMARTTVPALFFLKVPVDA